MLLELATIEKTKVNPSDYLYLAEIVARKFLRGRDQKYILDTEEYSVACLGLVNCIKRYNPNQGEFSRYAFRNITNFVIDYLRKKIRNKKKYSFSELTDENWGQISKKTDESNLKTLPDDIIHILLKPDESDTEQDCQDRSLLEEIYLHGVKIPDIAIKHNISRVTVYNRMRRIIEKIRQKHSFLIQNNTEK